MRPRLASIEQYVLVAQSRPRVESYIPQPSGSWLFTEFAGLDAAASFDPLACRVPLAEICHQVEFAAA